MSVGGVMGAVIVYCGPTVVSVVYRVPLPAKGQESPRDSVLQGYLDWKNVPQEHRHKYTAVWIGHTVHFGDIERSK